MPFWDLLGCALPHLRADFAIVHAPLVQRRLVGRGNCRRLGKNAGVGHERARVQRCRLEGRDSGRGDRRLPSVRPSSLKVFKHWRHRLTGATPLQVSSTVSVHVSGTSSGTAYTYIDTEVWAEVPRYRPFTVVRYRYKGPNGVQIFLDCERTSRTMLEQWLHPNAGVDPRRRQSGGLYVGTSW